MNPQMEVPTMMRFRPPAPKKYIKSLERHLVPDVLQTHALSNVKCKMRDYCKFLYGQNSDKLTLQQRAV